MMAYPKKAVSGLPKNAYCADGLKRTSQWSCGPISIILNPSCVDVVSESGAITRSGTA